MDVRRSRRDRLASIPPDHLLLMARDRMFDGSYNRNTFVAHVTKVLERAAARGSDASWLLEKLLSGLCWSSSCWQAGGRVVGRVVVLVKGRHAALLARCQQCVRKCRGWRGDEATTFLSARIRGCTTEDARR